MNDSLQPYDIEHTASTYGISISSDIECDEGAQQWFFKGVDYKNAESKIKDYVAYREEGLPGIRIRQIRKRSSN